MTDQDKIVRLVNPNGNNDDAIEANKIDCFRAMEAFGEQMQGGSMDRIHSVLLLGISLDGNVAFKTHIAPREELAAMGALEFAKHRILETLEQCVIEDGNNG